MDGSRLDRQLTGAVPFPRFYDRHYDAVCRALSLAFGDDELAADCTQEAMLKAMVRYDEVATMGNPSGWLFRVGLNVGRSRFRKLRREVLGVFRDRGMQPPESSSPSLVRALATVPIQQRAVLVLRFYLDFTVDQTADVLGVAPGTVKSRQHRGLARLRELLDEETHR